MSVATAPRRGPMLVVPTPEEARLHERLNVYEQLLRTLTSLEQVEETPWLIKELFRVEAWRERKTRLGERLPASDLDHFVHDRPPHGLGAPTTPSSG